MPLSWRYVAGSVIGQAHVENGLPCQDANAVAVCACPSGDDALVVVVSDGAGSAACAAETRVSELLATGALLPVAEAKLAEVFRQTAEMLCAQAEDRGLSPRQFACTFLAAIVWPDQMACLQLGDGAIVYSSEAGYAWAVWPQSGEYINTTNFVTDPAACERLEIKIAPGTSVAEVALFTDGLQMLALRYEDRTVHAPFFQPMFARLRTEPPGESAVLTPLLRDFLSSPRVLERTDDDKTLVLASRSAAVTPPPPALPSLQESPCATEGNAT